MDEDDDELEVEAAEVPPEYPDCAMTDEEVEATEFSYSVRGPNDYIVSRPTGEFPSEARAEWWARGKFGARYRGRVREAEACGLYCFVVRKP